MESFLVSSYVYLILALLVGMIVAIILAVKENIREFLFIKPTVYLILLLIVFGGAVIRLTYTGIYPVVFNDEFLYLSTAENIEHTGQTCPEVFRSYPPEPWGEKKFIPPYPQLWPVLVSLVFKITGAEAQHRAAAFFSLFLSVITPILVFFAAVFLFKKVIKQNSEKFSQYIGLMAALFWACLPVAVKLSGCASPETASVFFIMLFLALLCFFRLYPTDKTFIAFVLSLCAVIQTRPENLLYVILFIVFYLNTHKKIDKKTVAAGLSVLSVFVLVSVLIMISGHFDPERAKVFTIETRPAFENKWQNIGANLFNNILFFSGKNQINPIFYSILALIGIVAAIRENQKWSKRLLFWFVFAWLVFAPFPFGDYSNSNSSDAFRFSLHMYIPMILLMAFGCVQMLKIKLVESNKLVFGLTVVILLGLTCFSAVLSESFLKAKSPSAKDYDRLKEIGLKIREEKIDAHFISDRPDICLLVKYGTGFPSSLVETQEDINKLKSGSNRLFYYSSTAIPELYMKDLQMDVFLRHMDEQDDYSVFEIRKIE